MVGHMSMNIVKVIGNCWYVANDYINYLHYFDRIFKTDHRLYQVAKRVLKLLFLLFS